MLLNYGFEAIVLNVFSRADPLVLILQATYAILRDYYNAVTFLIRLLTSSYDAHVPLSHALASSQQMHYYRGKRAKRYQRPGVHRRIVSSGPSIPVFEFWMPYGLLWTEHGYYVRQFERR